MLERTGSPPPAPGLMRTHRQHSRAKAGQQQKAAVVRPDPQIDTANIVKRLNEELGIDLEARTTGWQHALDRLEGDLGRSDHRYFRTFAARTLHPSCSSRSPACTLTKPGPICRTMSRSPRAGFVMFDRRLVARHGGSRRNRPRIRTGVGYIGIMVAALAAFSYAGFNLSSSVPSSPRRAIAGIGFGLQNLINNFVSGLILLAERPIRVGDRVVVGGEEGFVRKISVRSSLAARIIDAQVSFYVLRLWLRCIHRIGRIVSSTIIV